MVAGPSGELRSRKGSEAAEIRRELPGRLTTQMQALATTELGLRVAIAIRGRIVEERVFRKGRVSVGPSFVVEGADRNATASFSRDRKGWKVSFAHDARAKLALDDQVFSLDDHASRTLRLGSGARGRIATVDGAILFQVVAVPPRVARPELPLAVRRPAVDLDWPTTVIGAFSFLVHFLGLGMLYSDWSDSVTDTDALVSGLADSIRTLPPPPAVELDPSNADKTSQAPVGKPSPKPGPSDRTRPAANPTASLNNDLDQMAMSTIAALHGQGPATADVLRGSDVPTSTLDRAAAQNAGVSNGSINVSSGGPIRPGMDANLADLVEHGRTKNDRNAASATTQGPRVTAAVNDPMVTGSVIDAARVVAGLRPGFHACYQRTINDYPDAEGSIRLSLDVGANGEVQSVGASSSGNVPGSLVSCVRMRARVAKFSPPDGGRALVVVPVTFKKQ